VGEKSEKTLHLQPEKIEPFVTLADLHKGSLRMLKDGGDLNFTDVGAALWAAAKNSGSIPRVKYIAKQQVDRSDWTLELHTDSVKVRVTSDKLKGKRSNPKNTIFLLEFQGGEEPIAAFVQGFVKVLRRNPWKFQEEERVVAYTGVSVNKIIKRWKKHLDYFAAKQAEETLARARDFFAEARKMGVKTQDVEDMLVQAQFSMEFSRGFKDFRSALNMIAEARKTIEERLFSQEKGKVTELLSQTEAAVASGEVKGDIVTRSGRTLSEAKRLVNGAVTDQELRNARGMVEQVQSAYDELRSQKAKAVEVIGRTLGKAREAKAAGVFVAMAEEYILKARTSFDSFDYQGAVSHVNQALGELEHAEYKKNSLDNKIKSARLIIESAQKGGVDVSDAEMVLEGAEEALLELDFDMALSEVDRALRLVEGAQDRYRQDVGKFQEATYMIQQASSRVDGLRKRGMEVNEVEAILTNANSLLERKDFDQTLRLANQALQLSDTLEKEMLAVERSLQESKKLLLESRSFVRVEEEVAILKQAIESFKGKLFSQAAGLSKKIYLSIQEKMSAPRVEFTLELENSLKSGVWNKAQVTVTNTGTAHVKDVVMAVKSSKVEMQRLPSITTLKGGESRKIEMAIKTAEAGEVPVDMMLSYKLLVRDEVARTDLPMWITVERDLYAMSMEESTELHLSSGLELDGIYAKLFVEVENNSNSIYRDVTAVISFPDSLYEFFDLNPNLPVSHGQASDKRMQLQASVGEMKPFTKEEFTLSFEPTSVGEGSFSLEAQFTDPRGFKRTKTGDDHEVSLVMPSFIADSVPNRSEMTRMMTEELSEATMIGYRLVDTDKVVGLFDVLFKFLESCGMRLAHNEEQPTHIEAFLHGLSDKDEDILLRVMTKQSEGTIEVYIHTGRPESLQSMQTSCANLMQRALGKDGIQYERLSGMVEEEEVEF